MSLALVSALFPLAPRIAEAHAVLVRADPPVNSQLRDSPAQLKLYFSEAVEHKLSNIRVLNSDQKQVDTGVEFDDQDNGP